MSPLKEIERALKTRVTHDPRYKSFREKTSNLIVLGLRYPSMQKIERTGFDFYSKKPLEILKTWNRIWNETQLHEAMHLPLFYYRRHAQLLDARHWKLMKHWIDRIENWEHADALCALYSIFLERYPKLVKPALKKWNGSKNPWKRRCSVVSTIYYASKKRTPPPRELVMSLITPLIKDKNPYVQKGVGWQLRECCNIWPQKTLSYLEKHILELPANTFSYATEKLSKKDKDVFKEKRRNSRKPN